MSFGIPKVAKAPSRPPRACLVVSAVWAEAKEDTRVFVDCHMNIF
jgi:hypothetical protein